MKPYSFVIALMCLGLSASISAESRFITPEPEVVDSPDQWIDTKRQNSDMNQANEAACIPQTRYDDYSTGVALADERARLLMKERAETAFDRVRPLHRALASAASVDSSKGSFVAIKKQVTNSVVQHHRSQGVQRIEDAGGHYHICTHIRVDLGETMETIKAIETPITQERKAMLIERFHVLMAMSSITQHME